MILNPNASVLNAYVILAGKQPSATSYDASVAFLEANGEAAYVAALENLFAGTSNAAMGANALAGLGLTEVFTAAQAESFFASNAGNRVQAIMDFAGQLSNYAGENAALVAAKTAFNDKVTSAAEYASDAANAEDGVLYQTFTLTEALAAEALPESYLISDAALEVGAVSVAGYADAVAAAQAIVDGSVNAAAVTVEAAYSLEDTLANLAAADAAVLSGAASYSMTDAAGRINSTTAAQAAIVAGASNAADYTVGTAGETFAFTVATDDDLQGTANDDVFNGTTTNIAATDEAEGGAGYDVVNITALGALAAASIDNVEQVNVQVRYFDDTTALDFTNIEADNVTIARPVRGFSDTVTVTAGGDNNYQFGAGITTATFSALEGGVVSTGSLTSLTTTAADSEVNVVVQGTTVSFTGDAGITDLNVTFDGGGTLDIASAEVMTGDVVITGAGTLRGAGTVFESAEVLGTEAILRIDAAATGGSMDLQDINVGTIRIDTATLGFTNAEGSVFDMRTASTFVADTSDDGGTYTVNVNVDNATSITTAAATNSLATAINHDSATVNINATAIVNNAAILTAGGNTQINVNGAAFTIDSLAEANTSALVSFASDQTVTVTSGAVTSFDGSAATGRIVYTNEHATTADVTLGSAGDQYTVGAASVAIAQTVNAGAGNDTIVLSAFTGAANVGILVDGGAGNDVFDFNAVALVAGGSIVLIGGEGTDTVDFDASGFDFTAVGDLVIDEIEVVSVDAGTYAFDAATLDGQTGLTIAGTAATGEIVTITTAATDSSLNLSGVTYSNIDTSTITLSTVSSTAAFTATLSNMADTVVGPAMAATNLQFNINAGAGNDNVTLTISAAGGGSGGTLTLGAGSDTVVMALDSSMLTDGAATTAAVAVANQLVSITDFDNSVDTLDVVSGAAGVEVLAGAAVDVSTATTAGTDSFSAYVEDGVIRLVGDDAANVDTVLEFVKVAGLLALDGTTAGSYLFELGGDTYVTDVSAAGEEVATVRLVGVTGLTLGTGGGADVITVA